MFVSASDVWHPASILLDSQTNRANYMSGKRGSCSNSKLQTHQEHFLNFLNPLFTTHLSVSPSFHSHNLALFYLSHHVHSVSGLTPSDVQSAPYNPNSNMHQLGVKRTKIADSCLNEANPKHPLCPRPRRIQPSLATEILKPIKCTIHSQQSSDSEIGLFSILDKNREGWETTAFSGCSPLCYAGSPPGRTGNPLIHDVQFLHQMERLPPILK